MTAPPGIIPVIEINPAAAEKVDVNPLALQDRVTVVFDAHHEQHGEQPNSIRCHFSKPLQTREIQTVLRKIKVKEQPHALDLGWIDPENAGMVIIENRAGHLFSVTPTPEELAETEKRTILVWLDADMLGQPLVVRAGRFAMIDTDHPGRIHLRASIEGTPANIFVFPK